MISYAILLVFLVAVSSAAIMDLLTMTIPNKISIVLLVAFLALAIFSQMPIATIGMHIAAGAAVLLVTFFMFAMGWIGGGDAKFTAAISVWMGFAFLGEFLLLAAVLGGAITVVFILLKRIPLPGFLSAQPWIARLADKATGVPYGLALAPAGLFVFLQLPYVQEIMGV